MRIARPKEALLSNCDLPISRSMRRQSIYSSLLAHSMCSFTSEVVLRVQDMLEPGPLTMWLGSCDLMKGANMSTQFCTALVPPEV